MHQIQAVLLRMVERAGIKGDRAASVIEYALLVGLIAVVCAVAIGVIGGEASEPFSSAGSGFTN